MQVKLLDHTKLSNAVIGARTCWDSFHKGGCYDIPTDNITEADKELLDRLIHKHKHESISEHCTYVFKLDRVPRFVLQELCRHRLASYSVRSSRYTLKELRTEKPFITTDMDYNGEIFNVYDWNLAGKYITLSNNYEIATLEVMQLNVLRQAISDNLDNIDEIKHLLPESYLCDIVWTINVRSLRNFLQLRLSKSAHFKIQELAKLVYAAIPEQHKFLYKDIIDELSCSNKESIATV